MGIMITYHEYNNPMYNVHKNVGTYYTQWKYGDCHTQNIQINSVTGENEKCLLFYGKTKWVFWLTQ